MSFVFRMEKGEELTYAEADANNRAVLRYAGESSDAADRSIAAAKSAETLLAMTSGQAGFPAWAKAGAPLVVNNTETGPVFSDRVLNNGLGIRPTMQFDFVNQGALDPRISFTRASRDFRDGKTYEINEPVLTRAGFWISGERANLFRWSEGLGDGVWGKNRVSVAKEGAFFKLSATGEVGNAYLGQAVPATPGSLISFSASIKKNSGFVALETLNYASQEGGGTLIGFDSSDGSFNKVIPGSGLPITVLDEGGSYRVSLSTRTTPTSTGVITFSTSPTNSKDERSTSPKAQGLSIEASFYQAEIGAATPYIPTEGSQVVVASAAPVLNSKIRSTDVFSIVFEFEQINETSDGTLLTLNDGGSIQNNQIDFRSVAGGNLVFRLRVNGVNSRTASIPRTLKGKVGFVQSENQQYLVVNGDEIELNGDYAALPDFDLFFKFGFRSIVGALQMTGFIKNLSIYKQALSVDQLKEITS